MVSHSAGLCVAPLAGAWIEILMFLLRKLSVRVAPLAGAWIEILIPVNLQNPVIVAPLEGAWIEIAHMCCHRYHAECRSPCGSVD